MKYMKYRIRLSQYVCVGVVHPAGLSLWQQDLAWEDRSELNEKCSMTETCLSKFYEYLDSATQCNRQCEFDLWFKNTLVASNSL